MFWSNFFCQSGCKKPRNINGMLAVRKRRFHVNRSLFSRPLTPQSQSSFDFNETNSISSDLSASFKETSKRMLGACFEGLKATSLFPSPPPSVRCAATSCKNKLGKDAFAPKQKSQSGPLNFDKNLKPNTPKSKKTSTKKPKSAQATQLNSQVKARQDLKKFINSKNSQEWQFTANYKIKWNSHLFF